MANLFDYVGPAFVVAVGFVDPGNWVTLIEGGSRFGYELVWVVLLSTLLAMLLQTVSARLGVITGKHFAQVCQEELPSAVCALLWGLFEISIITLDLTTVLGTAIGLNVVLRMPIVPSVFLIAVDSLLFMVLLPLLEMKRAVVMTVVVVGKVLLCFLLDNVVRSSLPVSMVMGLLPTLRHETLYATIGIVGASVMPHNFYLHSALVRDQSKSNQALSRLSHYHFLGTLFAFSAVLVVNVAVLSIAVTGFHNAGLVVLTLQDVQALIEQILNNSVCPPFFGLGLLYAGQLSTLNSSHAGQVVSEAFLDIKIYPWQHRILIRGIALVPVATCAWRYGNEGTYQMLVFSQVLLALYLPFTVVPLIKITSSERIMGSYKNSFFLETFAWLFLGILSAVNVTLVFDLVFGDCEDGASFGGFEYLTGLEWLTELGGENLQSLVFAVISVGTTLSLGFLVWLIFTPLQLDTQLPARSLWIEDYAQQEDEIDCTQEVLRTRSAIHETIVDSLPSEIVAENKEIDQTLLEDLPSIPSHSELLHLEASKEDADSSASIETENVPQPHLDSCDELSLMNQTSSASFSAVGSPIPTSTSPLQSTPSSLSREKPLTMLESTPTSCSATKPQIIDGTAGEDTKGGALKATESDTGVKTKLIVKDDDEMDAWESLEQDDVLAGALALNMDGSARSLIEGSESGKNVTSVVSEEGSGSFSNLSGLGRAARRQFSLILDDFWSNLFDLHGQSLPPPRAKGLPVSRGNRLDSNLRGISSSLEGSDGQKAQSKLQKSSWKKPSSMRDQVRNIDAYMLRMRSHAAASMSSQLFQTHSTEYKFSPSYRSECGYSSMHMPIYHEDYDYQPATIHGYRTPSFPGRTGSVTANLNTRQLDLDVPHLGSETFAGYGHQVDTVITAEATTEAFCKTFDHAGQPLLSSQWVSNVVGGGCAAKVSSCLLAHTENCLGECEASTCESCQRDPLVYGSRDSLCGRWNPLVYRATGELDMNNNTLGTSHELNRQASFGHSPIGRGGKVDHVGRAPLVFDELSPSQSHRDAFSIQTSTSPPETLSLWSRQPFEQLFGATDADGLTSHAPRQLKSSSRLVQSSLSGSSVPDGVEIKLEVLENLRICVGKLLRLDGADWLFRMESGADEDLITAIAVTQKTSMEADNNEPCGSYGNHDHLEDYSLSQVHKGNTDSFPSPRQQIGVPYCGKGCVWDSSLLISFGVWCVHRILELSFMESRPELWGKYTYVLNRLQGILEPAFSKPRVVPVLCRCINDPILLDTGKRRISSSRQGSLRDYRNGDFGSSSNQSYPHPWPWGRNRCFVKGKGLNSGTLVDMIKEVETAVGSRKGRIGTAAGDVAFPKGKENLASVLKRYKRRLCSKPPGSTGLGSGNQRL